MPFKYLFAASVVFVATPALSQSLTGGVIVSESPVQTQPLSIGETESLAVVTPEQAGALRSGSPALGLLPAEEQAVLDALPRITPAQASTFIEGSLISDPTAESLEENIDLYVVEDGTVLPAASWSAEQSAACKAAGGVELPLPADRIGCFKL
jgi:hypothetical protein